jgi:hypothetical protein
LFSLFAAACGGDDDASGSAEASTGAVAFDTLP